MQMCCKDEAGKERTQSLQDLQWVALWCAQLLQASQCRDVSFQTVQMEQKEVAKAALQERHVFPNVSCTAVHALHRKDTAFPRLFSVQVIS